MPYIDRDDQGRICGIYTAEQRAGQEFVEQAALEVPAVPGVVSRRQARQAMIAAGISFAAVQAAIDAIADPTERAMMQSEWDDSNQFERDRPQLIQLAGVLGLAAETLDALFIDAGQR